MERKGAAFPPMSGKRGSRPILPAFLRWRFTVKSSAVLAAGLALLATASFAVFREMSPPGRPPGAAVPRAERPARPALSPAEEAYLHALWPIHGDVERSTARITLGQIFYKINDLDRESLKKRVDEALAAYRRSEKQLRALTPPATVEHAHQEYLAAIRLFEQSAVELRRMFDDGRDDHM
ncbi:MAG: hypothetical protein ACM358_07760, partial [Gemmatimonadota bacterium]